MTPDLQPIAAVILAAGASSRMGAPKPLLDCGGETFLDRLIGVFSTSCRPVIAVLGHHAEDIRAGARRASEVSFVINPEPSRGMLSSLQAGLAAVPEECQAAFFHPCDMPAIQPGTIRQLIDTLASAPAQTLAAIPTFDSKRGHPVLIRSSWIGDLLSLPAGATARTLLESASGSIIEVAVADPGVRRDFDTRDEYSAAFGARP